MPSILPGGLRTPPLLRRLAALVGSFAVSSVLASAAIAAFDGSTNATHTVQTKRIFSGARTTGARTISDNSSGSAVSQTDALSYADGTVKTTGNWTTSFSSTRYLQFNLSSPLPAGVAVSGATFDFRMLPNNSGDTVCYYVEVRRQSDNSLLGTHYSSGSPQCVTGSTWSTNSVSLSEVTSSDVANDLYVKVFGRDNTANRAMKVDLATLTASMVSTTETLYEDVYTDASTGSASTTTWAFDTADSATYTNATNWGTAFSSTKYLNFTFPAYIPAGAVITAATFTHSYRPSNGTDNICHYVEVYSSTTLLAAHGSSGSPYSCNTTASFATDAISIPEVNTVAEANSVVVRVYVKDATAARKSIDDLDTLTITYSLD